MDASAAGNCAHNSHNHQEHIMNAAIGAVVVTPGAAVGFVFVDREVMWSGGAAIFCNCLAVLLLKVFQSIDALGGRSNIEGTKLMWMRLLQGIVRIIAIIMRNI